MDDTLPTVDQLAGRWRSAVAHTSLVSMGRAAMLTFLVGLTEQVLGCVASEEFDAAVPHDVGVALVRAHFTETSALERSLTVLGEQLAGPLGARPGGGARLAATLGALAAGYAHALQSRTRREQEQITAAALRARAAAEVRFTSVFDVAVIGIAVARTDGTILEVNPALADMLGYQRHELVGRLFWEFVHPDDEPGVWAAVKDMVSGATDHLRMAKTYPHKDGRSIVTDLVLSLERDPVGEPRYVVAMMDNVTAQHELQIRLRHQALHDPLTGLPNRTVFFERLDAALTAADPDRNVGICYLDLDGFKAVNDTLGHDTGDELLCAVAQRLTGQLQGHLVARMGGDEFVVLVERGADVDHLRRVAQTALDSVRRPILLGGREMIISASVGVVRCDDVGVGAAELMKAADTTMYWAKADGRDRCAVFDAERHRADVARFALAARMPEALARGEFVVEYQPLVRLSDQRLIGVEALVRWVLPSGERLGPDEFIPLAEQTGLIVPLGRAVLAEACAQAAAWRASDPGMALLMSVNLAARQLREPGIVGDVRQILAATGWDPQLLQLELTESDLMGTTESSLGALHALVAAGVRVAIDDFGTGYSNLAYLRQLPVHTLKLAGHFVTGSAGEIDVEVVELLVQLAHTLGLSVTAESVETGEQRERLLGLGCDTGQGWYFAASQPPEAIPDLVREPTW